MAGVNFSSAFGGIVGATEILQPLTDGFGNNVSIPVLPATTIILPVFIPGGTLQAAVKWKLIIDSTAGNGGLEMRLLTTNNAIPPFVVPSKLWTIPPSTFITDTLQVNGPFSVIFLVGVDSCLIEIDCMTENVPAPGVTLSLEIRENIFDLNPGSFSKGSHSRLTILKWVV